MKSKILVVSIGLTALLGWAVAGCRGKGGQSCGNNDAEGSETCDGSDLKGETCVSLGYGGGTLLCNPDCAGFDESGCTDCGNEQIDTGEDCDGAELGGETCETRNFDSGTLGCGADCSFDYSNCVGGCGNGDLEIGEECDGSDFGPQQCTDFEFGGGDLACAGDCTLDFSQCLNGCGNGIQEGNEECDGSELNNQTCQGLGFDTGTLACDTDCTYDTSGCSGGLSRLGGPCTADNECASGTCFTEVEYGLPGGYCVDEYDQCTLGEFCTNNAGYCLQFSGGPPNFCLTWCDPNGTGQECRTAYQCVDLPDGQNGYCWANCQSDADCTTTNNCNETTGFCEPPPEVCTNSVDDDYDNLVDCEDPDCFWECPHGEICDNNIDDDSDSLTDCNDGECAAYVDCIGETPCTPVATLNCSDSLTGETNDASGSTNAIIDWCGRGRDNWTGPEYTYQMTVNSNTIVELHVENLSADVDVLVIRDDGLFGCNPLACFTASTFEQPGWTTEDATFQAEPGYTYYIVVDGWDTAVATYDLSVNCSAGEDCSNGTDDDDDYAVDCNDPSCFGQSPCDTAETNCVDGFDNDGDWDRDCDDSDCAASAICTGSTTSIYTEDFTTWPATGWTVTDGGSTADTWEHCDGCAITLAGATGAFAVVDSDSAGQNETLDEILTSPPVDLSGYTYAWLSFVHNLQVWTTRELGVIEVSTDGSTWIPAGSFGTDQQRAVVVDISAVAGSSTAQFRFHYLDFGEWGWWWAVDTVEVLVAN